MLIFPLLLFIVPAIFGCTVLAALNFPRERGLLITIGSIGGLAVFTTAVYALNLFLPLSSILILSVLTLLAVITVTLLFFCHPWQKLRSMTFDKMTVTVFVLSLLLFSVIAPKLLFTTPDGLSTGIINAYGDIAWHVANITAFAEGQTVPPQDPIFAGTRLTYPFMTNYFSALLIKTGASITQSVVLPALLLIPLLLTLIYLFVREVVDPEQVTKFSQRAGLIALILFLFSGATLGWFRVFPDFLQSHQPLLQFIIHLPEQNYSGHSADPNNLQFLNPITSLLLPQRSFLFGIPIALSLLLLLINRKSTSSSAYQVAGVLAGILPLFHAHTIIAVAIAVIALFLQDILPRSANRRAVINRWLLFVVSAVIVGLPEVLYYWLGSLDSASFLRFHVGWTTEDNLAWFWFQNTGFILPAALLGLFLPLPKNVKTLTLAGLTVFIIANLFLFAPWAWDNFKLLVFWLIFVLPTLGWLVARYPVRKNRLLQIGIIAIVFLQIASAALDIWKIALPTATTWQEWDNSAIAFAKVIKTKTKAGESILTAPIHNSTVALTGRLSYL
ncbi:MAG: hypothetical protein Q8P73_00080, partial [bacterium]|nr:hypothetical protein [bacterium]